MGGREEAPLRFGVKVGHVERRRTAPKSKHLGIAPRRACRAMPRSLDKLGMTAAHAYHKRSA